MPVTLTGRLIVSCGMILALSGAVVWTQSLDEFDGWMRTIEEKNQSVQQNIGRRDVDAVTADARLLEDTFKLVEGFWVRRGSAQDAIDLARDAQAQAAGIAKAAAAKDFDGASSQAIKVAETCTTCHRLYRPLQ